MNNFLLKKDNKNTTDRLHSPIQYLLATNYYLNLIKLS